jgi:hypothetical protein
VFLSLSCCEVHKSWLTPLSPGKPSVRLKTTKREIEREREREGEREREREREREGSINQNSVFTVWARDVAREA